MTNMVVQHYKPEALIRSLHNLHNGVRPILFFDTGGIIDLQKQITVLTRAQKSSPAHYFAQLGEQMAGMYVTGQVLDELEGHRHCRINGHPEIPDQTYEQVHQMNDAFKKLQSTLQSDSAIDIKWKYGGNLEHQVYWASKIAFEPHERKARDDPMSLVDRMLVEDALKTRESLQTPAVVITSDLHVSKLITILNGTIPMCPLRDSEFFNTAQECETFKFEYTDFSVYNTRESRK